MCDTMVIMPSATKNGDLIFAKNSDRSPNEPLLTVSFSAKEYNLAEKPMVDLTYITIPQAQQTYQVVLMKPSWIWGAEMGFNEFGLNIGNEAVFTKEKKGKNSLIGMDMVRLALERTKDAQSALDYMIYLLEEYGQGGNCGFDKNFHYHNSFLIADKKQAFVLETAGRFYATKKVENFYAISNGLSIGEDYTSLHPDTIKNALDKGWIKSADNFNFAQAYTEKVFTFFAKSKNRRNTAMCMLEQEKNNITIETAMQILRSHASDKKEDKNSVASICMHAGGLIGDHTTGSYVASITNERSHYYITATSTPCMAMFKPFIMADTMPISHEDEQKAKDYWLKAERLMRYFVSGQLEKKQYLQDRDSLEQKFMTAFSKAKNMEEQQKIISESWTSAENLIDKYLAPLKNTPYDFKLGSRSYRKFWKRKTRVLQ